MAHKEYKTPLLDELEKGEWPSFVKEIKIAAKKNEMANDLLGQLEKSFRDRVGYWKHGGIVGVLGYGALVGPVRGLLKKRSWACRYWTGR